MSRNRPKASFTGLVIHLHPSRIPEASAKIRFTWCMGGLATWMFVIEALTGVLLLFHYSPSSGAYASIQNITYTAPYGFFIRNIHYWAGQMMIVFVVLHMIRVFVTGSYRAPRAGNWLVGVALLVGSLIVDFTGYLLVWDDRSLWAWTIARNLAETTPVVGSAVAGLLFGPTEAGDAALLRVYVWHVVLLPVGIGILTAWHFWRIRKAGGISTPL